MSHAEALGGGVEAFDVAVKERVCPFLNELGAVALGEMRSVYEQAEAGDFDAIGALAEKLASAITEKQAAKQETVTQDKPELVDKPATTTATVEATEPAKATSAIVTVPLKVEKVTSESVPVEVHEAVVKPEVAVEIELADVTIEQQAEPFMLGVEEMVEVLALVTDQSDVVPITSEHRLQIAEVQPEPLGDVLLKPIQLPKIEAPEQARLQPIDFPSQPEAVVALEQVIIPEVVEQPRDIDTELAAAVDEIYELPEFFVQNELRGEDLEPPIELPAVQLPQSVVVETVVEVAAEAQETLPLSNELGGEQKLLEDESFVTELTVHIVGESVDPVEPLSSEQIVLEDKMTEEPLRLFDNFAEALHDLIETETVPAGDEVQVEPIELSATDTLQEVEAPITQEAASAPIKIIAELFNEYSADEKVLIASDLQIVLSTIQFLEVLEAEPDTESESLEAIVIELEEQMDRLLLHLGDKYKSKEVERLVHALLEIDLEAIRQKIVDKVIDLEHDGTHEVKRLFKQVVSGGLADVGYELERLLGSIILSYKPAEKKRQLVSV